MRYLLDTDHVTLFERGHAPLVQRIAALPAGEVGTSPITVEESLRGRLASLGRASNGAERIRRYAQLIETVQMFQVFPLAPYDQPAEDQFQDLLAQRLRVGTQDLRIAAIALSTTSSC